MIYNRRFFRYVLFLSIFFLNFFTLLIPMQGGEFLVSEDLGTQFLRGLGFRVQKIENYTTIPRLTNDSMTNPQNININPFSTYLKQSEYFIPGWADTRWNYRKNITIDFTKVTSDLTNFPVLIDLYDQDLQNEAQASGNDILFTDSLGHILNHEIEQYKRIYNSTHAHLVAWVKTNLSSTQDTIISMYYGNPTVSSQENLEGVWDNSYIGVWHLAEDPTGIIDDSSSFGNDGTSVGAMTSEDQVKGVIDGCLDFDGNDDYIDVGNDSSLDITGDITIQFWVKAENYVNDPDMLTKGNYSQSYSSFIYDADNDNSDGVIYFKLNDHSLISTSTLNTGTWYSIVGIREGSTMRIYINGSEDVSNTYSTAIETIIDPLTIARSPDNLNGTMDEVRLSNVARSADWIVTEYNNQIDPANFYSIEGKESYGVISWANNMYRYRKNVTIKASEVNGDLTNFPVLIELFDADLFNSDKVQPDGDDIIFVDATGSKLAHEIDLFDQSGNGTHAHLVAWVRVPSLSSVSDTNITMYYGNPAIIGQENPIDVWSSSYEQVWHLEETSGNHHDSASGLDNGEVRGTVTQDATGKISGADEFNGISTESWIEVTNSEELIGNSPFTIEAWIYIEALYSQYIGLVQLGRENNLNWVGLWIDDNNRISFGWDWQDGRGGNVVGSTLSASQWYHAVGTYNGTHRRLYLDGTLDSGPSAGWYGTTNNLNWTIGTDNNTNYFDGFMDEIRISSVFRSEDWISTEYNNQFEPSSFYSVSEEGENSDWWVDGSFNKRRDIIINRNKVEGNLTDFPILIKLSDNSFKTGIIQSNGADILFVDINGTKLAHEIESFSQNITHGDLVTWVKVPLLKSNENTIISMYYGNSEISNQENPSAVWDNNYQGVWHLNNDPTSTIYDSTSNNNDGTSDGSMTQGDLISGTIGAGLDFDGIDDKIDIIDSISLNITDEITIETWVKDPSVVYYYDGYDSSEAWPYDPQNSVDGNEGSRSHTDWINPSNNVTHLFNSNTAPGTELGSITKVEIRAKIDVYGVGKYYFTPVFLAGNGSTRLFQDTYTDWTSWIDITSDPNAPNSWLWSDIKNMDVRVMASDPASHDNSLYQMEIRVTFQKTILTKGRDAYALTMAESGSPLYGYVNNSEITSSVLTPTEWHQFIMTYDGINQTLYIDGNQVNSTSLTGSIPTNANNLTLGYGFTGGIDEVRISNSARTAEWIATEYNNHYDPASFFSLGPELCLVADITIEETLTAEAENVNQITIPSVSGVPYHLYVLSASSKVYSDTTSVTGLDMNWTELEDQPGGRSQTGISVWYAIGSNPSTGNITVNLASSPNAVVVQLHRFSGIDIYDPIGDTESANTNGENGLGTGGSDDSYPSLDIVTTSSMATIFGVIGRRHLTVTTPGQGYTLLTENQIGSSGDIAGISTEYKTDQEVGTFVVNATLSGDCDWAIVGIEINPSVIDILAPELADFGVDDPGTGTGTFWANITDNLNVISAEITINGTEYDMTDNGTHWVYSSSVIFNNNYVYQILNATDDAGNSFAFPSNEKSYTFSKDTVVPDVLDWTYIQTNNTFHANVTDSWGEIDTVTINVTTYNLNATMVYYKTFGSNTLAYMNDTISMPNGPMDFQIIVNDTSGNEFISTTHSGSVYDNHPPVASDLTMSRDQFLVLLPVFSNCTLYLDYTYSDQDGHGEDGTEIRWYKDNGTGFELQPARNDTDSIPASELVKEDQWYATVKPKDGELFGEINQTATITIQNTPPQVSSVVVSPSNPVTTQSLSVSNTTSDDDGDSITAYQIRWYNPAYNASYDNQAIIPSVETTKGETWWCELRAFDGANYSSWIASNSVTIENSAPSASNLAIIPSTARTADMLTADYDFTDADNDPESGPVIRWYKNGVLQLALNDSLTVGSGNTTKGDTWYFKITPSDGTDLGLEKTSDPVTILNTAPTATSLYISPVSPVTTTTLTANYTWADSDSGDIESGSEIIWYRNNVLLGVLNDSVSVDPSYSTKGEEWHFKVRPSDGADYGVWTSCPANLTIGNTAPEVTNLDITPSDAKTGNNLTATYTWADNDTIDSEADSIIYWYLNQTGSFVLQPTYTNQSILSSAATRKGDMWKFGIIPSDGDDLGVQLNSSAITIGNTLPLVLNITINGYNESTMIGLNENLTVSYTYYDADNADNSSVDQEDLGALQIQWYNQSQLITGLNDELVVLTGNTSSGEIWYCIIRANDGSTFSNPSWSPSVSIAVPPNTPPNALTVLITPSNPKTGEWLNVTYVYYDEEGDPESFTTFRWYCNGIHQGQFDGIQNLSSAVLIKGDTWYAEVRPRDNSDFGNWNASDSVVIGNTPPEATNLDILPVSALTGSDLSVVYDWIDVDIADTDTNSIIYWYLNRTGSYILQSTYTNQSTVPSIATLKGDVWLYMFIPNDGTDVGSATNSTLLLIGNTAPSVSNLEVTPLNPITGDDLTADYDWLDQDTIDVETGSQIRWYKNGVLQPAYNDSITVNAGDTAKGENWYFKIVPSDGTDSGSDKTSPIMTIGNTAPSTSDVEFTPGVPTANIALTVAYNWTDVDLGDSESGTLIRWYRNDLLQATYNDLLTIDGILIVKGDNWTISIKASDGTSLSPTWVNASIIVGNTAPTVTFAVISPSSPKTLDNLEASYGATDNDSIDTITAYSIEWLLGGAPQPQFNNYTIIPAINTSKGENWQVRVKATDGEDWSVYLASLGLTIGNTKPSVANVTVTGGLTTSSNITLTYDFVDVDNDPSLGTTITWRYVGDGSSGTVNDLEEIAASYTKAGEQWWVEITPRDIDAAIGETFNSWDHGMIIIIGNTPPTLNESDIVIDGELDSVEYSGESFGTNYALKLHYNATDIDGEQGATAYGLNLADGYALGSEYHWYRNQSGVVTLISVLNDQITVPAQYTQKGDLWWVQVRPRDFFGDFGTPKNSSQILINNTAPIIQNMQWSRMTYYTTNSLTFSYIFFDYDITDGEQGIFILWYRNGSHIPQYDNNTNIIAQNTSKGEIWYVNISISDGDSYSDWYSLPIISIQNSIPQASNIVLFPTSPNTTQILNVSWIFTDADMDAEESSAAQINWYRNGILVPSLANNQTVPASWTNREEVWYFTARVTDGTNYSVLYRSNTVRVINSAPSPSAIQINLGSLPIYTSEDLTVTWGFTDPDPLDLEDVTSTFILWYLNGQPQASFINQSVIPTAYTLKGQQWIASLSVRDNGGLWSHFLNSSIIVINNTPPQITVFAWNDSEYYTTTNLSFSYLFTDADNDTEVGILIRWYRDGTYLPEYNNNVSILAYNTTKGEHWYVNISVFDGEVYSSWFSLLNISILNSAPNALNINLVPTAPNTTQLLEATWIFQDSDADAENQTAAIIQWYQNGNFVPDLTDQHNVSSDRTRGGDSWYFTVSVFDGSNYSISYQSNTIRIINSAPITSTIQLNSGEIIYAPDSLEVTWAFSDPDPQDIENLSSTLILWYLNGTVQPQFTNMSSIASFYLMKGQVWLVTIAVRDNGDLWSVPLNSSSVEIANSVPEITLHVTAHPEFIVEDIGLNIQSSFYTYDDADGDDNDPQIWWYRNDVYEPAFDKLPVISAEITTPGETWYYVICPYDGTDLGNNHTSPIIHIESRPNIDDHDVETQKTMDGLYNFWVFVSDTRNNITEVRYEISLNGSTSPFTYTLNSANATNYWVQPFQLTDFGYLGTTASVTVTATTTVTRYSQTYTISHSSSFNVLLTDAAPPRIVEAYFAPNDELNPDALTFYCELEEYGSGVAEVVLYYHFEPVDEIISNNSGSGAAVEQTYTHIPMNKHNESTISVFYSVTVPFSPNGTNWEVIYQIQASDNRGNLRTFNIPSGDPRNFIASAPPRIDPTLVMIIVGVTLFLAFFGSIVYVKFIRKPELVGLDKDLVLEKIPEISDAEIMTSLDAHTIGIVVSFFDQRHGPIPIIIIPEMLKDNFTKLVELSDRSFSGTGFSDDFNAEIPSSYDFVVAHGLRTSIISFGYALNRPQARGGQENITLNIIIHQDIFPLVQSFQKAIQRRVHKLHVHMDKNPEEKDTILQQVHILRKYVSSIVLSYERIYGTTELIEEED